MHIKCNPAGAKLATQHVTYFRNKAIIAQKKREIICISIKWIERLASKLKINAISQMELKSSLICKVHLRLIISLHCKLYDIKTGGFIALASYHMHTSYRLFLLHILQKDRCQIATKQKVAQRKGHISIRNEVARYLLCIYTLLCTHGSTSVGSFIFRIRPVAK